MRLLLRRRTATFVSLLFVLFVVPLRAHAQQSAPDSATILIQAALRAYEQGSPESLEQSIQLYQRALPFLRSAGDRVSEGGALTNIAVAHNDLGRADSALAYYAHSARVLRSARDGRGEGAALAGIGGVHLNRGRPDSALIYLQRALSVQRAARDRRGEAGTLNEIGTVYRARGHVDSAHAYFARALHLWRELGHTRGEAVTLSNIGMTYQAQTRADSAEGYFAQALTLMRQNADRGGEGTTLEHLAGLWARGGDEEGLRRAAHHWGQAGDAYLSMDLHSRAAAAWDSASRAYERIGARDSALAWMGQAAGVRDTSLAATVDSIMRSSAPLLSGRIIDQQGKFVNRVRVLLTQLRGRRTSAEEIPDVEAALAALEELNAHRHTWIEVRTPPNRSFAFAYRRWTHRNRVSPVTWTTRTAAVRFPAPRQGYQFHYIDPDTKSAVTFCVVCADSPCVVELPHQSTMRC